MKTMKHSIFRALCAIAVGALLVEYRQEMVQWMTITIGILFLLSGVVAVVMSYATRKSAIKMAQALRESGVTSTQDGTEATYQKPPRGWGWGMFAGTGSIIFGIVLTLMPDTFVNFLVYILSATLIIGAVQQFFTLALASRYGSVSIAFWIMPTLLLVAGIMAVAYPEAIASAPLFFIGWCMIVYGIVECVNGIKAHRCQKTATKTKAIGGKPDFSDAETVEYEEIKDGE